MDSMLKTLGWVAALGALIVAAGVTLWGVQTKRQLADAEGALRMANNDREALVAELKTARSMLAELEGKVKTLQETVEDTQGEVTDQQNARAFTDMLSNFTQEAGGSEKPKNFMEHMASAFQGEQGKKMFDNIAGMQVSMMYGDFFKEAGFDPELEDQVRAILADGLAQQMAQGMDLMKGGFDKAKADELEKGWKNSIRDALAQVLTDEQLADWEAYQEEIPARMLGAQYDQQLAMFVPDMDAETRTMIRDVIVEEVLASRDKLDVASDMDIQGVFAAQGEAFTRAQERLNGYLDENQAAQLSRFIEQQQQMMNLAGAMMGQSTQSDEQ